MKTLQLGDTTVDTIVEWTGPLFNVKDFFPTGSWEALETQRDWMEPYFVTPKGELPDGLLKASLHTYLIRTPQHNILIDTCMGNHKQRTIFDDWSMMDTDYLAKIASLGAKPEEIDFVMCTHLHVDHVGWNTQLEDGRWVPTFPNARYIFHKTEYDHWLENPVHHAMDGAFEDSVVPIVDAGLADLVKGDHAIDDRIWLEPTPGHTPGHVSINLKSGADSALFTGDSFHHPIQVAFPDWGTSVDTDPNQSSASRRKTLQKLCDTDTYMLAAHFMDPTAAHVVRNGESWKLKVREL